MCREPESNRWRKALSRRTSLCAMTRTASDCAACPSSRHRRWAASSRPITFVPARPIHSWPTDGFGRPIYAAAHRHWPALLVAPARIPRRYYETSGNSSPLVWQWSLLTALFQPENCRAQEWCSSLAFPNHRAGQEELFAPWVWLVLSALVAAQSIRCRGGTLLTFPRFLAALDRWAQQRQPSWPT